jgi:hypothetical protein
LSGWALSGADPSATDSTSQLPGVLPPHPGNNTGPGPERLHQQVDADGDVHPTRMMVTPMVDQAELESKPGHPKVMPMADQPRTCWRDPNRRIKIRGPSPAPWHERSQNPDAKQYDSYAYATYAGINAEVRFSLLRGICPVTRLGELAFSLGSTQLGSTPGEPQVRLDQVMGPCFPSGLVRGPGFFSHPTKNKNRNKLEWGLGWGVVGNGFPQGAHGPGNGKNTNNTISHHKSVGQTRGQGDFWWPETGSVGFLVARNGTV